MEYYTIAGMVLIVVIAIFSFYITIKKSVKNELGALDELNINVVRLNSNFEHMLERDEIRDKRMEKHGLEIDELKEKVQTADKAILKHELKIQQIEEKIRKE